MSRPSRHDDTTPRAAPGEWTPVALITDGKPLAEHYLPLWLPHDDRERNESGLRRPDHGPRQDLPRRIDHVGRGRILHGGARESAAIRFLVRCGQRPDTQAVEKKGLKVLCRRASTANVWALAFEEAVPVSYTHLRAHETP